MSVPREKLTEAVDQIPTAVQDALDQLDHLTAVIEEIKARGICTGTVYWRDQETNPKMYANHGTDQACPIHGTPESGSRLRVYVGTDEERQQRTLEAMQRRETLHDLARQKSALDHALNSATWSLRRILSDLSRW
jgi:hypothetical protein